MWWHRLRRLGPWGFVLLVGGVASPLVTCLFFGGVVFAYRYPWSTFIGYGAWMWLVTAPVYTAACLWTWFHMERRYRATLPVRCPRCGYSLRGGTEGRRCPECGESIGSASDPSRS